MSSLSADRQANNEQDVGLNSGHHEQHPQACDEIQNYLIVLLFANASAQTTMEWNANGHKERECAKAKSTGE